MSEIVASIICNTFNHEDFVARSLEGLVAQNTDFGYEIIVHDDASGDSTQAIIIEYQKKFPDLIIPILQRENQYRIGGFNRVNGFIFPRVRGKYIAFCEGDDYWTDPDKLQKQVDFLEAHPEYSMVFHNAIEHWEDGSQEDGLFSNVEDRDYTGVEIYENWIVPTASVVFRREVIESELYKRACQNRNIIYGDIKTFLSCAAMGKIRGMSDVMSVYRRHEGGVAYGQTFEQQRALIKHNKEIAKVFGNKYKATSRKIVSRLHGSRVTQLVSNKNVFGAIKEFVKYFFFSPVESTRYFFKLMSYHIPGIKR